MAEPRATAPEKSPRKLRLRATLDDALLAVRCPHRSPAGTLSIANLLDQSHGCHGLVVALVAVTAVPFVGVSGPFGFAIALLGLQIIAGRAVPWLPNRVRRVELSARSIEVIVRWLARATGWMTHLVRPRLQACLRGPAKVLVGLGLVLLGIGLALPVPIPGSNLIFLAPILLYALGLLEEDGVLVLVAHVTTLALLLAAYRLGATFL